MDLNRPEHGWLVCQACYLDFTHDEHVVRFGHVGAFHLSQGHVSYHWRMLQPLLRDAAF